MCFTFRVFLQVANQLSVCQCAGSQSPRVSCPSKKAIGRATSTQLYLSVLAKECWLNEVGDDERMNYIGVLE